MFSMQVFKAKWNGVQVVAVKQLRAISDDKAQLSFLREVRTELHKPELQCMLVQVRQWPVAYFQAFEISMQA